MAKEDGHFKLFCSLILHFVKLFVIACYFSSVPYSDLIRVSHFSVSLILIMSY